MCNGMGCPWERTSGPQEGTCRKPSGACWLDLDENRDYEGLDQDYEDSRIDEDTEEYLNNYNPLEESTKNNKK